MRCFMISASSLRREAYRRYLSGGYAFSGSLSRVPDRAAPPRDDRHKTTWLMNMQRHRCFISTHTNPNKYSYDESNVRIEVISREHIKPSSPTPQHLRHYKLSMFDQIEPPIYHPFMFFYLNNNKDIDKIIEEVISNRSNLLKQSLSQTLTRMYPFAGKLASELRIDCNDDGVYYIETRVDDRLNNVLKTKDDYKLLQRLIPIVESVPNQPLLGSYITMVQVNFFNCGSVSITVQVNHKLADARSNIMFMNTWASIARRDPNQVHANFVSSSMFPQNPVLPFSPYIPLWYLAICPAYIKHGKSETKRFVFDALALRELKAKASEHQPVSRVVAVLAFLWKCLTIVTQSKPSVLHTPVDIRQQLLPQLHHEYSIGNMISGAIVRCDHGASKGIELASMASQLKNEITASRDVSVEELKGENGHVMFLENVWKSKGALSDFETEYHLTSSLCNSGTKEVDFGWGKPVWFCTGNQLNEDVPLFTNRIVLLDSCSGDGIEAWVTLEKEVMDVVKCNPELLSFASVNPSPL